MIMIKNVIVSVIMIINSTHGKLPKFPPVSTLSQTPRDPESDREKSCSENRLCPRCRSGRDCWSDR